MNKKYIFLILCLFCIILHAGGQEAEFKKIDESWTLNTDGSQVYRYSKVLDIYTHTAMNSTYGESFIVYNPNFQEVKINASYTRQKNGNIVQTPENAFVEVLPAAAANAPAYNHMKEMVVVHTGLELGATIYLDYSITSKPGYLPELDICRKLQQSSPVKEYNLCITVPQNKSLEYELANMKSQAATTQKDNMKQVSWKLKNLSPSSREPQVSIIGGELPMLVACTAVEPMKSLTSQFENTNNAQINELVKQLTKEITPDNKDGKVKAIHDYVIDNLAYSPFPLTEAGYQIRSTEDVIRTAYGTEAEKIKLLAALLNAVGIQAEIGAICAPANNAKALGMSSIQEFFVWIRLDSGQQAMSVRSKAPSPAFWQQDYAHIATITNPFSLSKSTTSTKQTKSVEPDSKNAQNGYFLYSLPAEPKSWANSAYSNFNSQRKSNLLLQDLVDESFIYSIQVPTGMTLATPVCEKSIDNPVGNMTISIENDGPKIKVIRKLKIKKQLIRPADYDNFRQLMVEYTATNGKCLLFKTIEK